MALQRTYTTQAGITYQKACLKVISFNGSIDRQTINVSIAVYGNHEQYIKSQQSTENILPVGMHHLTMPIPNVTLDQLENTIENWLATQAGFFGAIKL